MLIYTGCLYTIKNGYGPSYTLRIFRVINTAAYISVKYIALKLSLNPFILWLSKKVKDINVMIGQSV